MEPETISVVSFYFFRMLDCIAEQGYARTLGPILIESEVWCMERPNDGSSFSGFPALF